MSVAAAQMNESPKTHKPQYTMQDVSQAGRLRDINTDSGQRNMAVAMHLTPLGFFIVGPLAMLAPVVLWLIRKDNSPFEDDHGKEMTNVAITSVLVSLLVFTGIGAIFTVFWCIVILINMIRGAVASSNGEFFRYPMTLRFIN